MTPQEFERVLPTVGDGLSVVVTLASGRALRGVVDGEKTEPFYTGHLYWEDAQTGAPFRARWADIETVAVRSAVGGTLRGADGSVYSVGFVVPPEHPLSGETSVRKRPFTTRNG